ncbi:hypothetical protein BH24ACT15_BH24ACT15_30020 [soil metagenome]
MSGASDARRLVAEFLGTALLLVAVVGSGIITSSDRRRRRNCSSMPSRWGWP